MMKLDDIAKALDNAPGSALYACIIRRDGLAQVFVKGHQVTSDYNNVACVFLEHTVLVTMDCDCETCVKLHNGAELALACIPDDRVQVGHG